MLTDCLVKTASPAITVGDPKAMAGDCSGCVILLPYSSRLQDFQEIFR